MVFSNHGSGATDRNVDLPYDCLVEPTFVGYVPGLDSLSSVTYHLLILFNKKISGMPSHGKILTLVIPIVFSFLTLLNI